MRIAIAGSSGLIGTALRERLTADGHDVVRLRRGDGGYDVAPAGGANAVINLAGAGIGDRRWTAAYKRELRASRLDVTSRLAALNAPVLLNASGINYYGADHGDEPLDESSPAGADFLAGLCRDWEAAAAASHGRVVMLRSAPVQSRRGGALHKQLLLFRLGLGGRFGSGRQWLSWISLADEVAAIVHLLAADVEGPVNLSSPNPVRNAEFARVLGKALHRPAILPIPAFAPKLVLGGELIEALLLASQRVLPNRLIDSGFTFAHPTLAAALRAELDT